MASSEWGNGWRTVASGGIGMTITSGVSSVTGIVMAPLSSQFGWSRTLITSNIMICAVLTLLLAPLIGQLIGRYGVRRCGIVGVLAAIPALVAIALNPGTAVWWVGSWILFGAINTLLGPLLWTTAVTELFDRTRGLALAIVLCGGGVAFAIFPPMALQVMERFDWRAVYLVMAGLFGAGLLPLTALWFRGRSDLRATGIADGPANRVASSPPPGLTLAEALRGRHFWQLAAVCLLAAAVEGAMCIHLYPILNEGGLAPVAAAGVASTMGAALIVGRLVTGFMLDRLPARYVFAAAIAAILVSSLLVQVFAGDRMEGILIATLLGFGAGGTINSLAYLTGRYFGLAGYASIFGLLMGIFAVGYGVAPMVASHARELLGNYPALFPSFSIMLALSIVLSALMGKELAAASR